MKVLCVVLLVLLSPCSMEGLSWSFHRPTPNVAPARRLSQLRSSSGPSSFCKWDCSQGVVRSPLPIRICPTSSGSCSLLSVARSQPFTTAVAVTHTFGLPACHSCFKLLLLLFSIAPVSGHGLDPLGSLQFFHFCLQLLVLSFQSCNMSLQLSLLVRQKREMRG